MPMLSRILGWTPPDNEDYLDVELSSSPLLPLQNPTFHISEPNPIQRTQPRCVISRNHFESTSPASSNSALSTDGDCDGDNNHDNDHDHDHDWPNDTLTKRVDSNGKHVDPSWVARPRNEFILFRCDYVRKHSREGKRVRRAPGAEAEKTLSKQAAEAWHHLPPDERLYWKDRANGERNEHARRYPDYRYRPKKSATRRRRKTRSSPNKQQPVATASGNITSKSMERTPVAGHPDASVLRLQSTSPTLTRGSSTAELVVKSSMMRPRRSCSVPELNGTAEPGVNRRLRSTASHGWIAVLSNGDRLYNPTHSMHLSSDFGGHSYSSPTPQTPSTGSSRLIYPTSSSLLNWNGERMVTPIPQPTQFLSPASVSFSGSDNDNGMDIGNGDGPLLTDFTTGGNPIAPSQMFSNIDPTLSLSLSHHTHNHNTHAHTQNLHQRHPHCTAEGDIWLPQTHPTHSYLGDEIVLRADDLPSALGGSGDSGSGSDSAAIRSHDSPSPLLEGLGGGSSNNTGAGAVAAAGGGGPSMYDLPMPLAYSHLDTNTVDYGGGLHSNLHSGMPGSSPEALFAMDTDELFGNFNY